MGPLGRAWLASKHAKRLEAQRNALNTEGLLQTIDNALHPKQLLFVNDKALRIAALVGARGGKSTGGRARFLKLMMRTPRAACLFVAPKLHQAKKILWQPFQDMLHRLGIVFESNETDLVIRLAHNGSTLMLGGAANKADIDRYRGLAFHEIGIDEVASFKTGLLEVLIDQVLEPRLGDYEGALWLISTPGRVLRGQFYEATRVGSDTGTPIAEQEGEPEGFSTHHWSLQDGAPYAVAMANAWRTALKNKKRKGWADDHPVWQREYLGLWSADDTENVYKYRPHDKEGKPWNQWDPEIDENGIALLPEHLRDRTTLYSYGVDPGIRDPFGLVIFAWSPHDPTKTLYQVYEFESQGMYAEKIANLFLGVERDLKNPKGLIGATGWPAAKTADKQNQLSLFEELYNVYGISFKKAEKKDKQASIELFNGDLLAGRIKAIKGSKYELQLMTLQYAVDEFGNISEDSAARNDLSDAGLYARNEAQHLHSAEPAPKLPYFKPDTDDEAGDNDQANDENSILFYDDYYDEIL